jgi:hypothetical protein
MPLNSGQFWEKKSNQNTPNGAEWGGFMSRIFLLVAGLTDLVVVLGGIWGQNKAKVSVFNGSLRWVNVLILTLKSSGYCISRQEL